MESGIETTSETTISKNLTLDLNGYTLNVGANSIVINAGNLTVEDSSDSENKGTISGTNSSTQSALIKVGVGYPSNAETFTLKSGNITITSNNPAVGVNNGSTVNIEGGKITAPNKGIEFLKGSNSTSTVNIKGGEIHVSGTGDNNVFAINDNGGGSGVNGSSNIINIEGGTITSNGSYAVSSKNNGQVTVSGGTITSASENFKKNGKASFTVTGGTFSGDVSECISAGVESVFVDDKLYVGNDYTDELKNNISTYKEITLDGVTKYYTDQNKTAEDVASVLLTKGNGKTSYYSTLEKAIAAADNGSTITLNKEITLTARLTLDKKITLDLNGQTITATSIITISDGGELTLKGDSEGKGTLSTNINGNLITVQSGGKFTIESGTVINSNTTSARVAINNSGTVTINGGTIDSDR